MYLSIYQHLANNMWQLFCFYLLSTGIGAVLQGSIKHSLPLEKTGEEMNTCNAV